MDVFTEHQREYHTDLIQDSIDVYEHKKEKLSFSHEEHIDLVLNYSEHVDILNNTTNIKSIDRYNKLYFESAKLAKRMASIYTKQREFNFTDYYNFCKIISQMMEILSNETEYDIEEMFSNMNM